MTIRGSLTISEPSLQAITPETRYIEEGNGSGEPLAVLRPPAYEHSTGAGRPAAAVRFSAEQTSSDLVHRAAKASESSPLSVCIVSGVGQIKREPLG